jgi:hypothetical protein
MAHLSARADKLPSNKVALLHVAKRDLKLTDGDYRAILSRVAGVDSATDLDAERFELVMRHFAGLGFRSTWTKRTFGDRPGMASPSQVELIRKLWAEYRGGADEDDATLNTWLDRFHHVARLRFVDAQTAARIIPGLKRMAQRK